MIDVRHEAKKEGLVNKFRPAKRICEERLLNLQGVVPADSLPNLLNCVRQVNRGRESARPQAPAKDNPLFTIVLSGFPPDFYLGAVEVTIEGVLCRHLLFASQLQLRHLANIKLWMGDGTFDIIALPFKQLWSIHGTILGEGGESKSVPLLHVAMTRRKEADYVAVLQFVKSKLHAPAIKQFTSDYEMALWKAVEKVFPGVEHWGCSYHQIQAEMRRLKDKEHLATEYRTDPEIRRVVQLTLCLCYLHHSEIRQVFLHIVSIAPPALSGYLAYLDKVWISDKTYWQTTKWSVYNRKKRTNNDPEGTHNRWRIRGEVHKMTIYKLSEFLFKEQQQLLLTEDLVSYGNLDKNQSVEQRLKDERLAAEWGEYEKWRVLNMHKITPFELLERIVDIVRCNLNNFPANIGFIESEEDE